MRHSTLSSPRGSGRIESHPRGLQKKIRRRVRVLSHDTATASAIAWDPLRFVEAQPERAAPSMRQQALIYIFLMVESVRS